MSRTGRRGASEGRYDLLRAGLCGEERRLVNGFCMGELMIVVGKEGTTDGSLQASVGGPIKSALDDDLILPFPSIPRFPGDPPSFCLPSMSCLVVSFGEQAGLTLPSLFSPSYHHFIPLLSPACAFQSTASPSPSLHHLFPLLCSGESLHSSSQRTDRSSSYMAGVNRAGRSGDVLGS